ncbi:basic blue protein [Brachypodium distachyon]|uniref:Phytocyanin domain-containing protein n=1 Tax=Brachypodium distachyon TaxID=15368 RepID=I1GMD7_BRADI|nr:basic blue protein [Brachypodium distachyon]KQK12791.1 hypothetical protein BRADI_1g05990v3 [Brachypodium distachyon]|eukprot:XP_003559333.1 basic blue protein [Brachypodium distachyon]
MASGKITLAAAMAALVVAALLPATASAAAYTVGDGSGWDLGIDYTAWAKGKKFRVGDTLEFLYSLGEAEHNVVVVDATSYASCSVPSNAPTFTSGDDTITLTAPGEWFFICGIEGHCQDGMYLDINVH